jgi:signal transduction histidine kinase
LTILILPPILTVVAFVILGVFLLAGPNGAYDFSFDLIWNLMNEVFYEPVVARELFSWLFLVIVLILLLIASMLTRWFHQGVFLPIQQLNKAMQNIADGNFEYILATADNEGIYKKSQSEIAELYHNYEDMRLRLNESIDEKMEAEKQNHELVSNISHDLRTPITAIKGYVEGLIDGVADTPERMDRYIRTIYSKANDLDRLLNELTFYTGIDANKIPYNFSKINVAQYFGECIEELGMELEAEKIRLNYSNLVSPETVIIADAEQLRRIINNIIGNSVKYIDREKKECEIDIRILNEIDAIRLEIEDNGCGISARDLGNIFERFYRSDASRNSASGGYGIGLSIVKKIVEDHGGYIWATSREGEGTCMHIVLRKYQQEDEIV